MGWVGGEGGGWWSKVRRDRDGGGTGGDEGACGCGRGRLSVGLNGGPEARTGTMPFGSYPLAPNYTYFSVFA